MLFLKIKIQLLRFNEFYLNLRRDYLRKESVEQKHKDPIPAISGEVELDN